jgi:glycosyltransferase involved in cell wall biosynthesis
LAERLGLDHQVRFLGRLERQDVLAALRQSTCVVVPSVAFEGFSLVALEAALLERPVVASSVGGLPETVLDGVSGAIVDPYDSEQFAQAVDRYLSDARLNASHGRNARERALQMFSYDRMVAEVNAVHMAVLA